MELHEKLLSLRREHGMTQDDLARALFVTRQSVYKWETGRSLPDIEKIKQICQLFDISADELLDIVKKDSKEIEKETGQEVRLKSWIHNIFHKKTILFILFLFLIAVCILMMFWIKNRPSGEVEEAVKLGIISAGETKNLESTVSEKDFLNMLERASVLHENVELPILVQTLQKATNEQLTREKAAYWVYCVHIWTMKDGTADLTIENHGDETENQTIEDNENVPPVTVRNVYEDLNSISRVAADGSKQPWEWSLCEELKETGQLFDAYDGTAEMDMQINDILYGPYYTAVTFCAAQKSFINEKPLLENSGHSFRPKEKLTKREAVIAASRLYESW